VTDSNTALSAIRTLVVVSLFGGTALAQSVLNFTPRPEGGITITNTTPYAADIKLTLYNSDGSVTASGALNPVNQRIPARGQISKSASQIFQIKDAANVNGWIQASSPTTGLQGFYFSGESASRFGGVESAEPQTLQVIPYIPPDPGIKTSIRVTNPTSQPASFSITYFDSVGGVSATTESRALAAHQQLVFPGRGTTARILSDIGILAVAEEDSGDSLTLINGQGPKSQALGFVAPHFKNGEGDRSFLVLANPTNQTVQARVSFFADLVGAKESSAIVSLRANGSTMLDSYAITDLPVSNADDGWLLVESTGPLSGLVFHTVGSARTALPLQATPGDRMLFSRFIDGALSSSTLSLVGSKESKAVVTVALSRPDGTTISRRDLDVPPLFRISGRIRDLLSIPDSVAEGYITVQSSTPVYSLEILDIDEGASEVGVTPQRLASGFPANPVVGVPRLLSVALSPDVFDGVKRLSITGANLDGSATLYVNGRVVPINPVSATGGRYTADLPASLEPGYINVKIRAGGAESNTWTVGVFPDDAVFIRRHGRALYQKWEVTENGLDPNRTVMVPIRFARVEVFDLVTNLPVSVSETNDEGEFDVGVPNKNGLTIRVLSRFRSSDVKVLDNTFGNRLYALTNEIEDPLDEEDFELVDTSRQSGAFNILDNVGRANTLIAQADPQLIPPPINIFWSQNNNEGALSRLTGGLIKTTFFNLATNTAYVLGDRNTDSDEFDDSVILHEYAHMLAARFSRDDSPGGPHVMGDILDPRLAWSEGWANFFSSAVRGTSIYLDTKGPGVPVVRYDLEENVPANDRPGYWSEASVDGLLWDLLDENADKDDLAQFPFSAIWAAFTDLRNARFVYLPHFLESFLARNPGFSDALRTMVIARQIDFQPDARPSVGYPFPKPIGIGLSGSIAGDWLDSYTPRRTNLATSSHFYSFTTTGGLVSVRLDITGLGPANNPNANDLDLYLYDSNGRRLDLSDRNLNGQPELIAGVRLGPGTYYIEVRSFYTNAQTNTISFNSGEYRLTVLMQ